MATLFNSLNVGYSGLSAAQVGINTTGHNITNAETDGYTRQRVVQAASTPLYTAPGNVGNGVTIDDIARVFDNFVFERYTSISSEKEYSDFEMQTLDQLSTYFPEIDGVGVKADLAEFYNMWQTFADNPDNDAIKVALAQQTQTLAQHISQTQNQVLALQSSINEQLAVNIDQVNKLAEQLADLNRAIDVAEAGDNYTANDLRDKRNVIERDLARLIGAEVNHGQLSANIQIDSNANIATESYTLSVNGFNIVDGATFHPLHLSSEGNPSGFYEVSYKRQDGTLIPMEEEINGGKIGAIFDLRGGSIDSTSGLPTDGILQDVVTQLDAFAKGLIQATNNLYGATATQKMSSNVLDISPTTTLANSTDINTGSFELVVYDIDGNEVARRAINIDNATVMSGSAGSNSIQAQIEAVIDDNGDGNASNDIDDFLIYNFQPSASGELRLELMVDPAQASKGYTFSIQDKLSDENDFSSGSNFAGALGLGRYFDGDSAKTIDLHHTFKDNPTKITAGFSSTAGDNRVALNMVQQQFESYDFNVGGDVYNSTMYEMFDVTATYVGITTNSAITRNETVTTQFNSAQLEYDSVSKVSLDEEMTNLIKYQTSYGAAAKVITTVDQMMQTLLGIKQ
ncbi:MAG: flagellar hook-associated protein FlgK [Campylobacterales bacterium]|nr:flagellar hook-associated protein FlgK [Campylobacterales bacterium]